MKKTWLIILITALLLFLIAALVAPKSVLDLTDVKDYTDTAKFFAGDYAAKQRSAHSELYGLMLAPYAKLTNSFFLIKLSSAFFLSLLIFSVYYISKKNKKTLLLFVTLPIIWFLAPWICPIPLASLCILWAYFFIKKFEEKEKIKHLVYSGLLIGLASAFWDTALYLSVFFAIAFLYNKKFYCSWIFFISLIAGILPRLLMDQIFHGFLFYSILKHISAVFSFTLYGGMYGGEFNSSYLLSLIIFALFLPLCFYLIYKKENRIKFKKEAIFLTLTLLFIMANPQPRLLIILAPIATIIIGESITKSQFKKQIIISIIISLLVLAPYIIQTKYDITEKRFDLILASRSLNITEHPYKLIQSDLASISKEFPNEIFLVGNKNDDYRQLAHYYWGDKVKEFVSIEDYLLAMNNQTDIAGKRIGSHSSPNQRRDVWIEVGLSRNSKDSTNYKGINYAMGLNEPANLEGFELVKKYDILYLSKRIE